MDFVVVGFMKKFLENIRESEGGAQTSQRGEAQLPIAPPPQATGLCAAAKYDKNVKPVVGTLGVIKKSVY